MISLLHVSDTHVGDTPWWIGTFVPRSGVRQPTRFPTNRGHDERVAEGLATLWLTLKQNSAATRATVRLVHTGDVTRQGDGVEYACAWRLFHAQWTEQSSTGLLLPGARIFGLGAGDDAGDPEMLAVPGNHDYWQGVCMNPTVSWPTVASHFWPLPWVDRIVDRADPRFEIHVVGLDTMSGLGRLSLRQFLATGAIDPAHLQAASGLLVEAGRMARLRQHQIGTVSIMRVVAMHHPIEEIDDRERIKQWLVDNEIRLVLCGHTHVANARVIPGTSVTEMTCGATTQCGTQTRMPSKEENHLFVHHVEHVASQGVHLAQLTSQWWFHDGAAWYHDRNKPGSGSPLHPLRQP